MRIRGPACPVALCRAGSLARMWRTAIRAPGCSGVVGTVVAAVLLAGLTACGSGDSTVSQDTGPRHRQHVDRPGDPVGTAHTHQHGTAASGPVCGQSGRPRSPGHHGAAEGSPQSAAVEHRSRSRGNYNECAQLSAVIVRANTNASNPNTRAVLFHQGKFIPTGVPDTFGFNGIDAAQSTGDTVALKFTNTPGLDSVVKFRWNGNGVELIGNAG